jgi:hypothetical protein
MPQNSRRLSRGMDAPNNTPKRVGARIATRCTHTHTVLTRTHTYKLQHTLVRQPTVGTPCASVWGDAPRRLLLLLAHHSSPWLGRAAVLEPRRQAAPPCCVRATGENSRVCDATPPHHTCPSCLCTCTHHTARGDCRERLSGDSVRPPPALPQPRHAKNPEEPQHAANASLLCVKKARGQRSEGDTVSFQD